MTESHKYSSARWVAILLILCLSISVFVSEWNFARLGFFYPRIFNIICYVTPSICLFGVSILIYIFRSKNRSSNFLHWYNIGVAAVSIVLLFQWLGHMGYNAIQYVELSTIQSILFGYLGFWLACDSRETTWLLSRIALICCILGLIAGIVIIADITEPYLFIPMWPIRLIILFGYCWYLYLWITGRKIFAGSMLGLIACSMSVWITFQKPIIFAATVSTIFTFGYSLMVIKKPSVVFKRLIIFLVCAGAALSLANMLTSGRTLEYIINTFYSNFIRTDRNVLLNQIDSRDIYSAFGGRIDMWEQAFSNFQDNPYFGGGKDNWGIARHPHNWFIDMILWVGLIGSFPFFAGLFWCFRTTINRHIILNAGNIVIPCFCYLIGILAYNMGGSMRVFHSIPSFVVLIMAICAGQRVATLYFYKEDV